MKEGDGPLAARSFTLAAWLPRASLALLALALAVFGAFAFYSHRAVSGVEDRTLELEILKSERAGQEIQLQTLNERLRDLSGQVSLLRAREEDLILLTRDFSLQLGLPEETELVDLWPALVGAVAWTWGGPEGQGGVDSRGPGALSSFEALRGLHRDLDRLESSAAATEVALSDLSAALKGSELLLAVTPYANPVPNGRVSSLFGYRSSPFGGGLDLHQGLDISAPVGTKVYAPADGTVLSADWSKSGYGLMVTLDHGHGLTTRYAHLSATEMEVGREVKRGEVIGKVGSTGRSTGPHLHYETVMGEVAVDPLNFTRATLEYQNSALEDKAADRVAAPGQTAVQ
jgi:septal ring factor EnvC (AmiA/AmiB activator)